MKTSFIKSAAVVATMIAVSALAAGARAQSYPERAITVVVPASAGGSLDFVARLVSAKLAERLAQPVVVENLVGANGTIGTDRVVRAKPDGYTLLVAVDSQIILGKLVTPATVPYDALKDLVPVSQLAVTTMVLTGRPGFEPNNIDDFVRLIQQSPGKTNYASWGIGSTGHVVAEMISQRLNTSMYHVPYKGTAPVVVDLAAGRVDVAVLPAILAVQAQKTAPVKIYGVTSATRWPLLKDVPSLSENAAFAGFEYDAWYGLFAPAGTDPKIVAKLAAEVNAVLKDPNLEERLRAHGTLPMAKSPARFATDLARERDRTAVVVQKANIKGE
jgi:tripartite-type tricarboxylate transporter receptor subunit TctC